MSNYLDDNDSEHLAFARQAQLDYTHFLQHRSCELLQGGVLILVIPSFNPVQYASSPTITTRPIRLLYQWTQALFTAKELLDYTIPIHHPSFDDYLDHSLFTLCALQLIKAKQIISKNPLTEQMHQGTITIDEYARARTLVIRTLSESILEQVSIHNIQRETIINQF
jgi:hypothetical protein